MHISKETAAMPSVALPRSDAKQGFLARLGDWFERFATSYGRHVVRSRLRYELMQLSDRELSDIGISRSEIDAVAGGWYDAAYRRQG